MNLPDKKSSLHIRFESYFKESYISNNFYYKSEEVVSNTITKSWDYGIYNKYDNKLVMVVDIDGSYYHGDDNDYNGLQSREEYDERRFLSIPNGIKCCIIYEKLWKRSFEYMIKNLMLDYDQFVEYQFQLCRYMPFPLPRYTDEGLLKSYTDLVRLKCNSKYMNISINNRSGDRLINHFHPSIFQAHAKGQLSPYVAWQDDELLLKVIKNRIIYVNTINPNKILQGFNISKTATKVSVFSAGRAKYLINKYLDFNTIFDPFSGFSGRMLGAISLGREYIGQDISPTHIQESNNIINFLKSNNINCDVSLECKDILDSNGEYPCLFTCSPYSDKEQWVDSKIDKRSCDDWIYECLNRFKCYKYLFIVDDTKKYKDYIVDEIKNKGHMGRNKEYVILIEK